MKYIYIGMILWPLAFCMPADLYSQDRKMVQIETIKSEIVVGILISEDENKVVIQTETFGEITIERDQIRKITFIDPDRVKNGKYWFENPQATRYFFTTNAIGIRKGQGYYQNAWIFFNNVNYGLSENISIGGGVVPMFLFGVGETPVWILPKVSIPIAPEYFYVAAGALLGGVIGEGDGFGLVYGVTTYGNRDNNLSVGVGYGYAGKEWSNTPMINISGMVRTGRSFYLLSENYFFPSVGFSGIISGGIRWAPENFALDFGLFRRLEEADNFIGFPWLGVTIPFGR